MIFLRKKPLGFKERSLAKLQENQLLNHINYDHQANIFLVCFVREIKTGK